MADSEGPSLALDSWPEGTLFNGFIIPYPPGVPLVVPGDTITPEILKEISRLRMSGTDVWFFPM